MERYQLGLYEKAMPNHYSFGEKLSCTRTCGFDYLEFSIDETEEKLSRLEMNAAQRREMRRTMEETGVSIGSICLSGHRKYPFGSSDPEVRRRSLWIMEQAIILARELGIPLIQLAGYDVYYEDGDADSRRRFEENLRMAVDMAAAAGVLLGFETMETPFMDTAEKSMVWVRRMNSPYLGVYPDVGNLTNAAVLYGHSVTEDLCRGKGHIFAAHLKETKPGVYRDMDFSTGHTPYADCIGVLWRMGVRRFTGEFWYKNEPEPAKTITSAAKFLRKQMERGIAYGA